MTARTSSALQQQQQQQRQPPLKQKMALGIKSLLGTARRFATGEEPSTAADVAELFPATDPAVDGEDCTHDCESCHVSYPRGFKIEENDLLYGHVKGWSTHVIVATGKTDWVRDVEDEKGSVMEAFGAAAKPSNGVSHFVANYRSSQPIIHRRLGGGHRIWNYAPTISSRRYIENFCWSMG